MNRVGVGFQVVDDKNLGSVAFLGFDDSGKESLFNSQFELSPSDFTLQSTLLNKVTSVGDPANQISPDLTGDIQDLNIYDPINNLGQMAFWVKTTTPQEAIVRANPIRKPILILPGIGGSLPKDTAPNPFSPGNYAAWIRNRGVDSSTLEIDNIRNTFNDLIETLKRAGYVEGVNLFVATYDWRLNPGPIDTSIDGKINRSAAQLTDDTYEYSVDHLGYWLKEAVKGWRGQFTGLPDNEIPELDSVDLITHSTGGLVARTYIQAEDAYGKSFQYEDDNSNTVTTNLPKVNNLFMIGVPNRGSSLTWNPLKNNFISGPGIRTSGAMIRSAWQKVLRGGKIQVSGKDNIEGVINPPPQDIETFIEQYIPTYRALLATYPFIATLDNPNQLQKIESIDPSQKNNLLLDLNNGFDSISSANGNPNLFANKVLGKVEVIYGRNVNTRDAVVERDRPDKNINGSAPAATLVELTESGNPQLYPKVPKGIWYRDEANLAAEQLQFRDPDQPNNTVWAGDGTVPLQSAIGTFVAYPNPDKIKLNGFAVGADGNTQDELDHTAIVSNIDVQKLILEKLGVSLDENRISTNLLRNLPNWVLQPSSQVYARAATFIIDPVEGFLVDGQGRRLGYSQATGAVTEIPNSFWIGQEEGIGRINGVVEGPVKLQLTGLGQDYFVSVALETENGPAGLEVEGFLAQGEQKTFDIPVNNSPILDLNGSTDGLNSNASLVIPAQTIALNDPNNPLTITDPDSPNLQGATVTIANPQDGTSESLSATSTGNITVTYDSATQTLTLSGSDTIANYQQVLRSVTYTNNAATPNLIPREITFEVNDGAGFNNLSPIATTTVTLDQTLNGTTGNDTLIGNSGNDTLNGEAGNDQLEGKAGNDILNGGTGDDTLIGDTGNDIYIVDSTGDLVTETSTTITESDRVEASISYTLGSNLENLTLTGTSAINGIGNSFNNAITGNAGNNALTGGDGNDTLDGAAGNDTLTGDTGNDLYILGNTGDLINETSTISTEIDSVQTSVSYTLSSNLETLTLTGTTAINGGGNALNNTITGNTANNIINGLAGSDTMIGETGNDTYYVDSLGDVVTETSTQATETDTVISAINYTLGTNLENLTLSGAVAVSAIGNNLNNAITGNAANNSLNGGTGNDTLTGGSGNDTYNIDSTGDVVNETSALATEIDTVISTVAYILGANLENLTLGGTAAINGTGNTLNNRIVGNTANNALIGGAGNDTLIGGTGNDFYNVDSLGDVVTETSTVAIESDTVVSTVTYTLGANLERLTLVGTVAINGTGNNLDNTITGNAANNTLNGGIGNDSLTGGAGNDIYEVDSTGDVVTEASIVATEIDSVTSTVAYTLGANLENLTLSGAAAINGTGNNLNNTITGNTANNTLNGGTGNDTLTGGTGNDTYNVDSVGDVVTETSTVATEIDSVTSTVTYTLVANLENLTLSGAAATNGTGNNLNNAITGNTANNILNGGTGNDTITGGTGNDIYNVDSTGDVISETSTLVTEIDAVTSTVTYTLGANLENLTLSGTAAINGTGNSLNNAITGNTANNILNGGLGNDTLTGGTGNDTYYVDSLGDVVSETSTLATEIDTVFSTVSRGLLANQERLILEGTAAINGTGNALNNSITGNTANNILNGGTGNDSLTGGAGNDSYNVDSAGDVVTETSAVATEIDTVTSTVTYTLGANIESLTLSSTVGIDGTGNNLNNTIAGNTAINNLNGGTGNDTLLGGVGNDILVGGSGNDSLTGGVGSDRFTLNSRNEGIDQITDFVAIDDTISVSAAGFGGGLTANTVLGTTQFVTGTTALDANDRFIYNGATGALFFDLDGNGATAQVQIATFNGLPSINSNDIFIAA